MEKETRAQIFEVLMLLEDNLHTSASDTGLEKRYANMKKMQSLLFSVLDLSEREVDNAYWKWDDKQP